MKKILLPSLLIVGCTPMISMVGCSNSNGFSISNGRMSLPNEGSFQLNWTNGHDLTFAGDWNFATSVGAVASVTATGGDAHSQTISISFSTEITARNITDGTLTFTYNDLTTKEDNIFVTINNIYIEKFTPEGVIITPGPTDLVDTIELASTTIGLKAELPNFKVTNAYAEDLMIAVTSDAWIPVGEISATVEVTRQISSAEQEFSIVLTMEDPGKIQPGDIYQLHIQISLYNEVIFTSDEYKVNVKESITKQPAVSERTCSFRFNSDESYYWAKYTGFYMARINDLIVQEPLQYGQEYRVTLYELDEKTIIEGFSLSYYGETMLENHYIVLKSDVNIDQNIQFKVGITRSFVDGGKNICTVLNPFSSEIFTLEPYVPG